MKILAVDTSSKICAVSILDDEVVIKENSLNNGLTHSENFMPLMEKTLQEADLTLDDIDLISCVVGPGSFTGIRIGIASIKAIAQIKYIPVVSVTSLESLAYNVAENSEVICSIIDARNNQVYCGIFDYNKKLLEDYIADDIMVIIDKLKRYNNIVFVGDAQVLHRELLEENFKNSNVLFSDNNEQNGKSCGLCGLYKFKEGIDVKNHNTINPIYLRKSQAERLKK
ncbi:MAG: tRNA (adenosine(37)-N6)-threonylcarbamoyltransferase complex dimerization subunit type 1 TsaB [Clostridia bacterium]|nr:tRNA (adenosine(37)-N6)-threonylcarbamoyltransferase complex dimerization subunit type 1 TsaB [Clostridia bacterium]